MPTFPVSLETEQYLDDVLVKAGLRLGSPIFDLGPHDFGIERFAWQLLKAFRSDDAREIMLKYVWFGTDERDDRSCFIYVIPELIEWVPAAPDFPAELVSHTLYSAWHGNKWRVRCRFGSTTPPEIAQDVMQVNLLFNDMTWFEDDRLEHGFLQIVREGDEAHPERGIKVMSDTQPLTDREPLKNEQS